MKRLILCLMLGTSIVMAQDEPIDTSFYIELVIKNGWFCEGGTSGKWHRMCDGKRCEGLIVDRYENGQIEHEGFYRNGHLYGEVIDYYENGQIESIGNCDEDGYKIGNWKYYYESGQLWSEIYRPKGWRWENPKKWVDYYEDGTLESKEEYSDDYRVLYSYYFNENGDTSSINRPLDFEKQVYEYVEFYDNGNRKTVEVRQFIEGEGWKDFGHWLYYDENGKLEKVVEY